MEGGVDQARISERNNYTLSLSVCLSLSGQGFDAGKEWRKIVFYPELTFCADCNYTYPLSTQMLPQ